jgi:hypothetical protein
MSPLILVILSRAVHDAPTAQRFVSRHPRRSSRDGSRSPVPGSSFHYEGVLLPISQVPAGIRWM